MSVYVDSMRATFVKPSARQRHPGVSLHRDASGQRFGRMVMCHMIADTDAELHAMADAIGVARRYWQAPPAHDSHYDVCLSKRALAVKAGAIEISWRECGSMCMRRRITDALGQPHEAVEWVRNYFAIATLAARDRGKPSGPTRLQLFRTKGKQMPQNTLWVGSPSKWANPLLPGMAGIPDAATAVQLFRSRVERGDIDDSSAWSRFSLESIRSYLRGKHLACRCPIGTPCHADTLLELANV